MQIAFEIGRIANSLIPESLQRKLNSRAMHPKSLALELPPHSHDAFRISAGNLPEPANPEQHILERIHREIFRARASFYRRFAEPVKVIRHQPIPLAFAARTSLSIRLPTRKQQQRIRIGRREFHAMPNMLDIKASLAGLEMLQVPTFVRIERMEIPRNRVARDQNQRP